MLDPAGRGNRGDSKQGENTDACVEKKSNLILMSKMICCSRMGALPSACVEGKEAKGLEMVACNESQRVRGDNEG